MSQAVNNLNKAEIQKKIQEVAGKIAREIKPEKIIINFLKKKKRQML